MIFLLLMVKNGSRTKKDPIVPIIEKSAEVELKLNILMYFGRQWPHHDSLYRGSVISPLIRMS